MFIIIPNITLWTIILPNQSRKDLEEIPAKTRKDLKFIFVENMDEVLRKALITPLVKVPRSQKPSHQIGPNIPLA